MRQADRLSKLPPYLFGEIDRKRGEALAQGRDVIDLGVGDPDRPTPGFILDRMREAIRHAPNHRYAPTEGRHDFREAAAAYLKSRFNVRLDPDREIISLLGTKEGIGHLPTAVVNPGDVVLVPAPGYPVYAAGSTFAGGTVVEMPLLEANGWLPDLDAIPHEVLRRTRLMYLNYPNNPTAAIADRALYERAIGVAQQHGILIAQDAAYIELYHQEPPISILQIDGEKESCIEFHSLSKTFNMTGWRVGFAAGNRDAIAALAKVKSNLDSGVFGAIQDAAVEALHRFNDAEVRAIREVYRARRDVVLAGLREAGWNVDTPQATFFVWAKCPEGWDSMAAATRLLDDADVVVIPGAGFGPQGEGYVRFALTIEADRLREAMQRLGCLKW
jgi:LL-diaminopimelate aminotransferase